MSREIRVTIEILDAEGETVDSEVVLVDEGDASTIGEIEAALDSLLEEEDEEEEF